MVLRAWFGDQQMPDLSLAAYVFLAIYLISLSLSFLVYKILTPALEIVTYLAIKEMKCKYLLRHG